METRKDFEKPVVCGVDNAKVQDLVLNLYSYLETIKTKLNLVDDEINGLKTICKGKWFNSFVNSYEEFQKNFSIIEHNIQLYAGDLTRAKNNFQNIFADTSILSKSNTKEERVLWDTQIGD